LFRYATLKCKRALSLFQRSVVATVRAQDGDRGQPNDIVYSLVSGTGREMFGLDASTGQIRLSGRLDRDRPGKTNSLRLGIGIRIKIDVAQFEVLFVSGKKKDLQSTTTTQKALQSCVYKLRGENEVVYLLFTQAE